MPLFMDFHKLESDGITEEDVYKAHLKDVAVQNTHSLIYKRYYLNLNQKTAFCLMEGPSKEACIESHKEAHGVGACNVIEVSHENEFIPYMGEGNQNEQDLALTISGEIDSGFRTIMLVDFLDLTKLDNIILKEITNSIKGFKGNVVQAPGRNVMASFINALDAIKCSMEIGRYFETSESTVLLSIALATGKPVDEYSTNLFEETKAKVGVLSRLGFELGICMDSDTKLSAIKHGDDSKFDPTGITVIGNNAYKELEKLDEVLMKNLNNSAFNTDALGKHLGLSKAQTYRKIYGLLGLPPMRLLSDLRLSHAARLLKRGNTTVSEVAYDSGYNTPSYFTRVFRKRFNILPTSISK